MQFTEFEERCIKLVNDTDSRGKHCLRNAINHINRAWALRQIDANMAVFRAITAEEEAASGLIYALKERNYADSQKLDPRDHRHKSAVVPFIQILGKYLNDLVKDHDLQPTLHILEADSEFSTHLGVGLRVAVEGTERRVFPRPPLNFRTKISGLVPSYKPQIEELVVAAGAKTIQEYVRNLANLRNQVLYAGPKGFPTIADLKDEFFENRKRRVIAILNAYLLVQPYVEIQPFVQDAVHALVAMLGIPQSVELY